MVGTRCQLLRWHTPVLTPRRLCICPLLLGSNYTVVSSNIECLTCPFFDVYSCRFYFGVLLIVCKTCCLGFFSFCQIWPCAVFKRACASLGIFAFVTKSQIKWRCKCRNYYLFRMRELQLSDGLHCFSWFCHCCLFYVVLLCPCITFLKCLCCLYIFCISV